MSKKPFCFRCGAEPKYQLSLRYKRPDGQVQDGPFWPFCYSCFQNIPWTKTLIDTVLGIEKASDHDYSKAIWP